MKTRAFCAALVVGLALFAIAPSAKAQQALVVDTCGTLPANLRTGQAKQIYQDKTGKQCVAASVSASITPFTPGTSGARGTPLTVTTSDSSGSLPTNGGAVAVSNVGTNPMYCNVNGVAATVADQLITANGGWFNFGIPAGVTTLHCIATGGSTTANSVGGSGLATGTGGGSGGGGGGTVTQGPTGTNAAAWWAQIGDTARGPAKVQAGNSAATTDVALTVADPNVVNALGQPSTAIAGTTPTTQTPVSSGATSKIQTDLNGNLYNAPSQAAGVASVSGGVPVVNGGSTYNTVAASQTAQALTGGGGGATGDYLSHCEVIPATTSPGNVIVLDNATSITMFAGGASSVSSLMPFPIPLGARSVSGAWKITTGANVSVVCVGKFT